jgi:transcriptional regulator with XRE-family HTH domain
MDASRMGHQFRALRIRRALRQEDVARSAGTSRSQVSKIERGAFESITLGSFVRASAVLGAVVDIRLRWNGEQLDRLLDAAHSHLVETVVELLQRHGWDVAVEASFSIWGERGSVDAFAYHAASRTVLVVEVKSVVPDSQATIHGLDRKARLAPQLAADRGWLAGNVARLLVIGSTPTSRRRIAELAATYDAAFPIRGSNIGRWLRRPRGAISGLLFVSYATGGSVKYGRSGIQRVRARKTPARGS